MGMYPSVVALLLACSALPACRTLEPVNPTLQGLQVAATPEPRDRVSPPTEQRPAKAAMVRWTEGFLRHNYRVTGQHFVLLESGFTAGALIGSKADRYVTQHLGGTLKTDGWLDDDHYALFLWQLRDGTFPYVAFVMAQDPLPGTQEQRLVGYFTLEPIASDHNR